MLDFRPARADEPARIFALYAARVDWMNAVGLHQWNETGYLRAYPQAYYEAQQTLGSLYVLADEPDGRILGAAVLLPHDERWDGYPKKQAWYVHNLVTAAGAHGAGKTILREAERLAGDHGMQAVRLDCAQDNARLNAWYEAQGYRVAGTCADGPYRGLLREKRL